MQNIISEAEKYYKENIPHNWDPDIYINHIEQVREYALILADEYQADREVLEIAALLHDIGYEKTETGAGHAGISADMARDILKSYNVEEKKIEQICDTISKHSMKDSTEGESVTLESQILRDADGIAFLKSNIPYYHNISVAEIGEEEAVKDTLKKIDGMTKKITTDLGKKIAEEYFNKARDFIKNK
jgi:putative nucleotidyltransferase with HDIG domain